MPGRSSGYLTEVSYTSGYYGQLAPAWLALVALSRGVHLPGLGGEPIRYCELGCGTGYTTNVLAAANPGSTFVGVDFNPAHIGDARELAAEAGLSNVTFLEATFDDALQRSDLTQFDYIALHGVYSWVSDSTRETVRRFARDRLNPGGALYVSYNALPGWASLTPMARLLREAAERASGSVLERTRAALVFLRSMHSHGARYFQDNPGAVRMLDRLERAPLTYVAHEFLNADHRPILFSDLARELFDAELSWVGPTAARDLLPSLKLTGEQARIVSALHDPLEREALSDHFADAQFRADVFVKAPVQLDPAALAARWREAWFILRTGDPSGKVIGSARGVQLPPAVFEPLVVALRTGPKSLDALLAIPELKPQGLTGLRRALLILCAAQTCMPAVPGGDQDPQRRASARSFNLAVAERSRRTGTLGAFASPSAGSGLEVERLRQLFWLAGQRGADPLAFAFEHRARGRDEAPEATVSAAFQTTLDRYERAFAPVLRLHAVA